jgi:hypothetical protein
MTLTWAKGGTAEVISVSDDRITLRSTTSAPPGARLEATLATGEAVKIKSHGTHKEDDGTFTLNGRLLDAPRALREKLAAASRTA